MPGGDPGEFAYCTTTVRLVLWLRLPEVAVTVTVYVPAGVPGVAGGGDVEDGEDGEAGELPPPQPTKSPNPSAKAACSGLHQYRRGCLSPQSSLPVVHFCALHRKCEEGDTPACRPYFLQLQMLPKCPF